MFSSHFILDKNESIFFCDTTKASGKSKRNTVCGDLLSEATSLHKDSFSVSSVPNNLNIFSTQCTTSTDDFDDSWAGSTNSKNPKNNRWQETPLNTITTKTTAATSIANCNFDLAQTFGDYHQHQHQHQHHSYSHSHNTISPASSSSQQQTFQQQKIINSSYSNLTLLDYSGSTERIRNQLRAMAESQKRNSTSSTRSSTGSTGSTEFSKCNFLLDEISAHFDKSLSILNDKSSFDIDDDDETDHIAPPSSLVHDKIEIKQQKQQQTKSAAAPPPLPPQPPPRRQQITKKPLTTKVERSAKASSELIERHTFDRDPTNLKTCYAESLERCNIDFESSNSINLLEHASPTQTHEKFQPVQHSTPNKREMVASTPNLIEHRSNADAVASSEECLHSSSAYNSLNPLPTNAAETRQQQQTKGILSAGSRNSLGKGVSFYPFVSQISWHEQSSAEETGGERSDSEIR